MARDEQLKERWEFGGRKNSPPSLRMAIALDLDSIIYLIGVQELGQIHRDYKKDHKLDLNAYCDL